MNLIDSSNSELLSKAMDAYALRQKAIASNVANIDTPGYKRKEVSFEDQLRKAEDTGSGTDASAGVTPSIVEDSQAPNIEDEMMNLADTQMRVQLVVRALHHNFQMIRNGIIGQ